MNGSPYDEMIKIFEKMHKESMERFNRFIEYIEWFEGTFTPDRMQEWQEFTIIMMKNMMQLLKSQKEDNLSIYKLVFKNAKKLLYIPSSEELHEMKTFFESNKRKREQEDKETKDKLDRMTT